jgi:hypothetical protein
VVQELAILALIRRGMTVMTASGDDLTDGSDPSRTMMRQIAASFCAVREGAACVAKLKQARDRKKAETGKCGGRESYAEIRPETVALAKQLQASGLSLRKITPTCNFA